MLSDFVGHALAIRNAGYMFVGECLGAADGDSGALIVPLAGNVDGKINHTRAAHLESCGSNALSVVRLDALLRDINAGRVFLEKARALFSDRRPALYSTRAEPAGINEVSVCAIAV